MNKTIYWALGIAAFMGCNSEQNKVETLGSKTIKVSVDTVKSEFISSNLRYSGSIEAFQTVPLNFQTVGKVEKVLVEAGDAVKKGQLLATIEKADLQNLRDISKAKYQQAKDAYDRLKKVHDEGSLPEIKWVEMETNLEQAKLSLELSENSLDKCNLRSPANSIVGRRNIEPGMTTLSIGSAPMELVDIDKVYVKISVPENEIGKIKKGLKAQFTVSALNNLQFEGNVTNVSPVADVFARTYEAKILVNNLNHDLKPGMVCDVTLDIKSAKELTLIPYQGVSTDSKGLAFVYTVDANAGRAKKQPVTLGNYYGKFIEVTSGLAPSQVIVCEGKEKLSDNSLISF
ncbi:hemolysin secretion protein D [Tenuifilaceae bacterium CYCD]|nr:hemolysin secretion protein D [Tenuifilaceae bacterium CYCD]